MAVGSAPGGTAGASTSCKPEAGAVVRTLRLNGSPHQRVRAHVGDTIKVIAHMKGYRMGVPKPVSHKRAVCRFREHRVSKEKVIAKYRAQRARKVTFASSAIKDGHASLIVGYANIKP